MGTEFFIAVGTFSVELLVYQISMVCAANWPHAGSVNIEKKGKKKIRFLYTSCKNYGVEYMT